MERLAMSNAHQKTHDPMREYHLSQKKALEINPRHPLIKGSAKHLQFFSNGQMYNERNSKFTELLRRVENNEAESAKELALIMFRTATLRSGFTLQESAEFADSVEKLMRKTLGISEHEQVEEEDDIPSEDATAGEKSEEDNTQADDSDSSNEEHDEL